jgi:hypothetical protein
LFSNQQQSKTQKKKSIQNSKRSITTYLASTQGQILEIIPLQYEVKDKTYKDYEKDSHSLEKQSNPG